MCLGAMIMYAIAIIVCNLLDPYSRGMDVNINTDVVTDINAICK